MSFIANATCLVGTLYIFYLLLKCVMFGLNVLKTTLFGGSINFTHFGEWAVVTGCTDGIGKAYAKQLAAKGMNIILMSRNKEKLDDTASEIEKDHKVKTKIVQVNFSGGHELYEHIAKKLEGFEIGVLEQFGRIAEHGGLHIKHVCLVNNVGEGMSSLVYYHELPIEKIRSMINVNLMSTVMLTRLIIPSMVERKKGVIINVSSGTTVFPCLFVGPYAGTKACMSKFSETLNMEYASKGILIQDVVPFWVATKMSGKTPTLFCPTPDDYVRGVLKKVGVAKKCFGYWPHELLALELNLLPQWFITKYGVKAWRGFRENQLRKKDKKKES